MSMNRLNVTAGTASDASASQEPALARNPRPVDWGHVVDAAAARLEESWVHPDTTGNMLASGLADELAATLCAYGMEAAEVDHMRDHEQKLSAGRLASLK